MSKRKPLEIRLTNYPLDAANSTAHLMAEILKKMREQNSFSTTVVIRMAVGGSVKLRIAFLPMEGDQ